MPADAPLILTDRPEDGIVVVRINRPEARNALNTPTRQALADVNGQLGRSGSVVDKRV